MFTMLVKLISTVLKKPLIIMYNNNMINESILTHKHPNDDSITDDVDVHRHLTENRMAYLSVQPFSAT